MEKESAMKTGGRSPRSAMRINGAYRGLSWAFLMALLCLSFTVAQAQLSITTPNVVGDQLIFFYDLRPSRTSFLSISNLASNPVTVEIVYYPESLAAPITETVSTLAPAANVVVDPTQVAAGGLVGHAGLAVVTPIVSEGNHQPIVPAQPLAGTYTIANTILGAAFGENPIGRRAVTRDGHPASAGQPVDGTIVRYQQLSPVVLTVPVYFNPTTLDDPAQDGNRVILAMFQDSYGARFGVTAGSGVIMATFIDTAGVLVAEQPVTTSGVLLSDLQALAGASQLTSAGKVFFTGGSPTANWFGLFSQSLGTFASAQRMPAVDQVPSPAPTPVGGTPTPRPTPTSSPPPPSPTPAAANSISGSVNGVAFDAVAAAHWIGMPDDLATTVVYLFDQPIQCAELSDQGWDRRIVDHTQVLEMKMIGSVPQSYSITTSSNPAAGDAAVNYTLSSTSGTPTETVSSGGAVTLTAFRADTDVVGSFQVGFDSGEMLGGSFAATWCPQGHEP